jgi:hypothetical protein
MALGEKRMSNLMDRINQRFNEKVNQRTASARSGRWDLKLADYDVYSGREARIMVAYAKEMGFPKRSEVDEWVNASFNGNVSLQLESLRNYPDVNVVTAIVHRSQRLRPFKDTDKMLSVGSSRFMDEDKVIWEVLSNEQGERYLSRATTDDFEEIFRLRQGLERTASLHHRLRLEDLVTAGIHDLESGDKVRVSVDGLMQVGDVKSVSGDNVKVSINGKTVDVNRMAIIGVEEASPKSQAEKDKGLKEFFEKAYGSKEFADKLVDVGD